MNLVRSIRSFEDLVIPNTFEITHGGPHVYVGGHMLDIICSPSDPAFFMHHAMVDAIWEHFRLTAQNTNRETEYPEPDDLSLIGGRNHAKYTATSPFPMIENWNGLSNFYEQFYRYAPFQETCRSASDCQSPYLWCFQGRCISKVRCGGDCSGFPATRDPCQCGVCNSRTRTCT